ncbi:hypothetical protein AMS68_003907 [Peltaster fructicola]|uniref:RRM domain-containing protein n=1 Tax=Peltaster fructicola TaxID=286661 RepID=A0A6H0XVB7_9PEZI|nr:hypothetical protein AMS68_003907 [Peltaster fructicola]
MNSYTFDMHYDNASQRSPQSQRGNSLNRQPSRSQFEGYAHLPSSLYTQEDHTQPGRFDHGNFGNMRNATIGGYGGNGYDMGGSSWNGNAFGANGSLNGLGGGSSMRKPNSRGRTGIPNAWMDQQHPPQPPMNPFMGGLGGLAPPQMRSDIMGSESDEELIPTAIVIKNIPFAVKKEQLVQIMTDMGLPLPYAFNYHFDNGVFRGLAFANFTNADETAAVIESMNHFELNGRKLRVEYKKMLPAAERERIEREKRERRGQLEEQHRPIVPATLQTQTSVGSLSSRVGMASSPSPVSARNMKLSAPPSATPTGPFPPSAERPLIPADVDLNDPQALTFYTRLIIFKEDPAKDLMVFPATLEPTERRIVHTLSHHMGLGHVSKPQADGRAVHVYKEPRRLSPPMPQIQALQGERRALNRAATTDFSDFKATESFYGPGGLRTQTSGYLSGYQDAAGQLGAGNNPLRAAKSFADLRSYTPSPVPSTASFPASLSTNVARLQEYARDGAQASTPTIMTPTSSLAERGDSTGLINGLGSMNLGSGFAGSPRGLRGFPSWDRETPGPIGGHRSFSTNFDERGQMRSTQGGPERQPRGPMPERGAGFPRRQNGHMARNSDEISQQSSPPEITVEH